MIRGGKRRIVRMSVLRWNRCFEMFIAFCVAWGVLMEYINYGLSLVFFVECLLKLHTMGWETYTSSNSKLFDLILSSFPSLALPSNTWRAASTPPSWISRIFFASGVCCGFGKRARG